MGYVMYFTERLDGDEDCFRLNIFDMSVFRSFMAERGMTFDAGQHPEWPDIEKYGVTWDDVGQAKYPDSCQDEPPLTDEQAARAKEYIAQTEQVLAWHGPEIPGIPEHKFCSNDGWIVLPAECEAAVRIGRQHAAPAGHEDYWDKWLDYMDRARRHGGFEVH